MVVLLEFDRGCDVGTAVLALHFLPSRVEAREAERRGGVESELVQGVSVGQGMTPLDTAHAVRVVSPASRARVARSSAAARTAFLIVPAMSSSVSAQT